MWNGCSRAAVGLFVLLLLVASFAPLASASAAPASPPGPAAPAHAPIVIEGNANFTAANGVVSGSGTSAEPYVIGPWDINSPSSDGVSIADTTAYFVLQDVNVTGPGMPYFSPAYDGVILTNVTQGTILRTDVSAWDRDVVLAGGTSLAVEDSAMGNANAAVDARGTVGLLLSGNNVTANHGFHLTNVPQATVSGNLFLFGGVYLATMNRSIMDSTTITTDNLIQGSPIRFYRQVKGLTVDGLPTGELIIADGTDVRIANLTIDHAETGFQVAFVQGLDLGSSNIRYSGHSGLWLVNVTNVSIHDVQSYGDLENAAWLVNVSNVTVTSSTFDMSKGGLALTSARDVRVTNIASHSAGSGIAASGMEDFEIVGSNLSWNTNGLFLSEAANGTVKGNDFYSDGPMSYGYPTGSAIVASSSHNVSFTGNNLTANGRGMWALGSRALQIASNRFVGNVQQAADDSTTDFWNLSYPGGGNYWSDYAGYDDCRGPAQDDCTGSDGFGDTPYAIPASPGLPTVLDRDYYPIAIVRPPNIPPVANIYSPATSAWTGVTLTFEGGYSSDPDGSIVAYAWDLGDGTTGTNHVIQHAYAASGNYTVTLTVTDNRHGTNATSIRVNITTWKPPEVALVVWTSGRGYQVPVPRDWTRHENVTSGNTTTDLELDGTYNGTPASLLVSAIADPTAQETTTYLGEFLTQTVKQVRQQFPTAIVADVRYPTLSGHAAIVFVLRLGSLVYEDVAVVVSAAHHEDWLISLTAAAAEETHLNATFDQILAGFTITAAAPGGPGLGAGLLSLPVLAEIGVAAVAAVGIAVFLLVRRRKKPVPVTNPEPAPEGPPAVERKP